MMIIEIDPLKRYGGTGTACAIFFAGSDLQKKTYDEYFVFPIGLSR
jgi:hypothetical protein